MRFIFAAAALALAAPAGAVTFTGTLSPVDGVAEFDLNDVVSALGAPSLKSYTFSITNGVITQVGTYAGYLFSQSAYDADGYDIGNNYYDFEGCSFNSGTPDGCWNTFAPNDYTSPSRWMKDLAVGQRSLTFNVHQPREFNDCTDPPAEGICSYDWSGEISANIRIASFRPVNFTWSSSTFGGAVPEPAGWAMMIAGFGVVGAAMRRRPVHASQT